MSFFSSHRRHRLLTAVVAAVAVGIAACALWVWRAQGPSGAPAREFVVVAGQGTRQIAEALDQAGLVRSASSWEAYVRLAGLGDDLKAGTYLLSPAMKPDHIARMIASGDAVSSDRQVTIPEGMNLWEVDRIFADAGLIAPGEIRSVYAHKEGHLYPETYRFASGSSAETIVRKMEATYFERGGTRGDIDLIIASMLEKEAKTPEDMALVAGIIQRRLEIGMPLQIDATVGYGWCVRTRGFTRDCDVTQAPIATEIKVDGPYNTYTRRGLPQGAIANPGTQALKAAANPTSSPYLYYLSTRDGSKLIYSKTLDEHLANRRQYLGF